MKERLVGRYLCEDLRDAESGDLIVSRNKLLTEADAGENGVSASSESRHNRPAACSANPAMNQSVRCGNVFILVQFFVRYRRVDLPADLLGNLNAYTTSLSFTR